MLWRRAEGDLSHVRGSVAPGLALCLTAMKIIITIKQQQQKKEAAHRSAALLGEHAGRTWRVEGDMRLQLNGAGAQIRAADRGGQTARRVREVWRGGLDTLGQTKREGEKRAYLKHII